MQGHSDSDCSLWKHGPISYSIAVIRWHSDTVDRGFRSFLGSFIHLQVIEQEGAPVALLAVGPWLIHEPGQLRAGCVTDTCQSRAAYTSQRLASAVRYTSLTLVTTRLLDLIIMMMISTRLQQTLQSWRCHSRMVLVDSSYLVNKLCKLTW